MNYKQENPQLPAGKETRGIYRMHFNLLCVSNNNGNNNNLKNNYNNNKINITNGQGLKKKHPQC